MRRAPATYIWFAVLAVTTAVMNHLTDAQLHHLLGERSTNLHHLAEDPLHVLFASAFWIDGGSWIGYFVLFNLFHVRANAGWPDFYQISAHRGSRVWRR